MDAYIYIHIINLPVCLFILMELTGSDKDGKIFRILKSVFLAVLMKIRKDVLTSRRRFAF